MRLYMPILSTCLQCLKPFTHPPSAAGKFCSKVCYDKYKVGKPGGKASKLTRVCAQCNLVYHSYPSDKSRYCSKACFDKHKTGKPNSRSRGQTRTCARCGLVLQCRPSDKRLYCSQECRYASARRKVDKVCVNCGVTYKAFPSEAKRTRFCSPVCKKAYNRGDKAARWKPDVPLTCEWCGGSFGRKPHLAHIRFCSRKCRNNWLRHNITSPTSIEIAIEALLVDMGVPYSPQEQIGQWSVDFLIPAASLAIECDGDYWHQLPRVQLKDAIKEAWLTKHGYTVLHLTEYAINNSLDECKARILTALHFQ